MLASVSLLAPYGLLACLLALVPVAVVALVYRRQRRVSQALGLEPVSGRRAARATALPALTCLLLGIAIAQPAVTTTTERSARTSSEVVFVADVSRSMTASSGPGERTRLERARAIVVGAARVRARRPGRSQRSHRSRPAVRVSDARRAGLLRDIGAERAGGVAATAGGLGRRHELRATLRPHP